MTGKKLSRSHYSSSYSNLLLLVPLAWAKEGTRILCFTAIMSSVVFATVPPTLAFRPTEFLAGREQGIEVRPRLT